LLQFFSFFAVPRDLADEWNPSGLERPAGKQQECLVLHAVQSPNVNNGKN
jgi:hypothetical protein